MHTVSSLVFALTLLIALPAAAQRPSDAQIEEARGEFEQGTLDYEAGRFEDALTRFRRAHQLTGSPDLLYNVATVLDRLRRDDEALAAYEQYLDRRPDTEDRANIEARIAVLRASIERARIERESMGVTAPDEIEEASPPPQPETPRIPLEPAYEGPGAGPWVLIASGAVIAVAGGVLLGVTVADIATVDGGTRWSDIRDAHDRVPIVSGTGFAALGVGVALAVAGVVWIATADADESARVALGLGSIAIEGSF